MQSSASALPRRRRPADSAMEWVRSIPLPRYALALPAIAYFLAFFVAPVILVAWYSFGFKPGLFGFHDNSRLSLDRYREALGGQFFDTLQNTWRIAGIGTAITLVIALPFAYFLALKAGPKVKTVLLVLTLVPFWTNFLIRTLGWMLILAPTSNLSHALQWVGLTSGPLNVLQTATAVQVGVVYNYLPLMILPMYVAMERLDPALIEASKDLGANRFRTLMQVTLPLAMPGIITGTLLVFVPLMGDYITASVLGGAKGTMVGVLVASWFQVGQNWALGSAEAVLLIVAIAVSVLVPALVLVAIRWGIRRRRRVSIIVGASRTTSSFAAVRKVPGAARRTEMVAGLASAGGLRAWTVLVYVFLFLPIGYIVVYSFNRGHLFAAWAGFGMDGYRTALHSPSIIGAVLTSLKAAVGTAIFSTILGTLAGLTLARRAGRWAVPFTGLLALVLMTPEIMLAISELPWFVSLGVDHHLALFNNGIVRLVVAHSLFATAVVTFIVRARMTGIDETLEEAAADLYASPWRRFRQVTLPLMMPAVVAGAMMAFTLSLDDTILSTFVSVQGDTPWPVYIFSLVKTGLRPDIASMATMMLVLTLIVLALAGLVLRRSGQSSEEAARTMTGAG